MASPTFNVRSPSIKRIMQESRELARCPDPTLTAAPLENNLFEWHFTLRGPPTSVYEQGIYHGRIVLPPSYPLRPPAFRFLTPSGRFETNREICLSISGHHEETWQPAWGIRTALCAIRAFMAGEAKGQVGGIDMHPQAREKLARESRHWRCAVCGKSNEDIIHETEEVWKERGEEARKEEVPEELRLAFREDLEAAAAAAPAQDSENGTGSDKRVKDDATILSPNEMATSPPPPSSPQLPRTPSGPQPLARSRPQPQHANPSASSSVDGLPKWIDAAIIGVAIALLIMVLRRWTSVAEEDF